MSRPKLRSAEGEVRLHLIQSSSQHFRLNPGRETTSPSGTDFGRELTTTSNGLVDAAACGRPEPTINRMDAGRRGSPTPGLSSLFPRPMIWRPDSWTLRLANRTSAAPRRNRLEHEPLTPA